MPLRKIIACLAAAIFCAGCRSGSVPSDPSVRIWRDHLARLDSALAAFQSLSSDPAAPTESLRAAYLSARLAYKRIEFIWTAAFPSEARRMNGPPVDEIEKDDEHTVIPPHGFQVLEAWLFPDPQRDSLAAEAARMRRLVAARLAGEEPAASAQRWSTPPGQAQGAAGPAAAASMASAPAAAAPPAADRAARTAGGRPAFADWNDPEAPVWSDSSLAEAARLEWLRIAFLGITGYESPSALQSLPGSRAALEGMGVILEARFGARAAFAEWRRAFRAAVGALPASADPDTFAAFDRAGFLAREVGPAYAAWIAFRDAAGIPPPAEVLAYSPRAKGPFEAAWNAGAFAPPFSRQANPELIALGRSLFFDKSLSADGSRSCAGCHLPGHGFSDPRPKADRLGGHGTLGRHAPSLLHAGFQNALFWDERAESLEDQADQVVHNPNEMGGSLDAATRRMKNDSALRSRFLAAFPADGGTADRDEPITPLRIRRALAAYVRSLAPFASPFDRFLRGDSAALSSEARAGFNLFAGKAGCANCHFLPLFNGAIPPDYLSTDMEVLGVPSRPHGPLDADSGAMAVDHRAQSLRAFKTPTVRNAAYTGPYMHNGAFATLAEVIDFYAGGGGAGAGLDVPGQTLPADSLRLQAEEKRALLAFLNALSDTAGTLHTGY